MLTLCWLKHLCSIRAWVPVSFFLVFLSVCLSVSLYFWLISWSAEARWAHLLARVSNTLSGRHTVPSPTQEGTWCLRAAAQTLRIRLLIFRVNQGISASFSLLLSYCRLQTTRFRSIKGPTENKPVYHVKMVCRHCFISLKIGDQIRRLIYKDIFFSFNAFRATVSKGKVM